MLVCLVRHVFMMFAVFYDEVFRSKWCIYITKFYFSYHMIDKDDITLRASMVSSFPANSSSYTFIFLNNNFQFNQWMFMMLKIQLTNYSAFQIHINFKKSDALRSVIHSVMGRETKYAIKTELTFN